MQLRRLGLIRRHGHGQETLRAAPAKVSSVSSCFLLQPDRQSLGGFNLFVENDGAMGVIAGLFETGSVIELEVRELEIGWRQKSEWIVRVKGTAWSFAKSFLPRRKNKKENRSRSPLKTLEQHF